MRSGGERLKHVGRAAVAALALGGAPGDAPAQSVSAWQTRVESSQERLPAFARTYGDAIPPTDFINFCARHPEECAPFPGTPTTQMSREEGDAFQKLQLSDTNSEVNAYPQLSDLELFGRKEHWVIAGKRGGDCEDLAALKKRLLQHVHGMRPNNLLLTHVVAENGEGHIVLMVRLRGGDYILDNRKGDIAPWSTYVTKYGYAFLSRQSYLNPKVWVSLKPKE